MVSVVSFPLFLGSCISSVYFPWWLWVFISHCCGTIRQSVEIVFILPIIILIHIKMLGLCYRLLDSIHEFFCLL